MTKRGDEGTEAVPGKWLDRIEFEADQQRARDAGGESRDRAAAREMGRAMLELSGEVGFGEVRVETLLTRCSSNRDRFYRSYRNLAQCYAAAYVPAIDELTELLLEAGAEAETWSAGMRQALEALVSFSVSEPALALGLIAEVTVVGGEAAAKRRAVVERLSRAIDSARRTASLPTHLPPAITSEFIFFGVEAALVRSLYGGTPSPDELLPALVHMAVNPYFGETEAAAQIRRIP